MKIRNKLTYLFTIIVGSILITFSFYIYFFSSQYRDREFYSRLREKAYTTARLLIGPTQIDQSLLKTLDRKDLTVLHSEEIMIFNDLDDEIYDSGSDTIPITKKFLEEVRKRQEVHIRYDKTEIIGVLYKDKLNKYVVVASAVDAYGLNKIRHLLVILIVGCLSSIAIVLGVGWFFSYKALEPMRDIVDQVDRIPGYDLSKRVKTRNSKDEINHLADTFNKMLARVQKAFEAQRSFVSNASHELRTPLTSITGQIEVILLKERSGEDYKDVLYSVLEDIKNLTDLSNALLELARVSGDTSALKLERVRIDELIWQARLDLLKKKPDYKVEIFYEEPPEDEEMLIIGGIEKLLRISFMNLMENGCKFSPDKKVKVALVFRNDKIEVKFKDEGIGMSNDELPNIFEPFYRASNALHIGGHGVGLSLVKKVIEVSRGDISVISELNKGTTFVLTFPQNSSVSSPNPISLNF